jgi:hypothetical protein
MPLPRDSSTTKSSGETLRKPRRPSCFFCVYIDRTTEQDERNGPGSRVPHDLISRTIKPENPHVLDILEARADPQLFARCFKDRSTWQSSFAFLAALFALPMPWSLGHRTAEELKTLISFAVIFDYLLIRFAIRQTNMNL